MKFLLRLLGIGRAKRKANQFIAGPEFLLTPEWRRARYDALRNSDGRCELCGRNKHQLAYGEYLNVDHIKPRKTHPQLALDQDNLQVLCGACNQGKGNRDTRDWRR
jgi:5-methylcytosine-specific restriction endonuclease McrA